MTTPDTLAECQQFCKQLKQAMRDLAAATTAAVELALRCQMTEAEEFRVIGRARRAIDRAGALAGKPPRREGAR